MGLEAALRKHASGMFLAAGERTPPKAVSDVSERRAAKRKVPLTAPRRRGLHLVRGAFLRKSPFIRSVAAPFRKTSRLLRLFACKRAHNGYAALPMFCGIRACGRKVH